MCKSNNQSFEVLHYSNKELVVNLARLYLLYVFHNLLEVYSGQIKPLTKLSKFVTLLPKFYAKVDFLKIGSIFQVLHIIFDFFLAEYFPQDILQTAPNQF